MASDGRPDGRSIARRPPIPDLSEIKSPATRIG
jgi:hypothetical protein